MALSETQIRQVANFDATAVDTVRILSGVAVDNATTATLATGATVSTIVFLLPDAATTTYSFTVQEKMEIVDAWNIKDVAGAANTIQLKNGAATAISDAMAAAVDKAVTHCATLDKATRVLAAGATLQITNTRAAGSAAAAVFVSYIRRA
jgi:hypothetical protein